MYMTSDLWLSAALFSLVLLPPETCSCSDLTADFSPCTQRNFFLCHTNSGPYICFWIFHVEAIKGPVYFLSNHSDPHFSALNLFAVSWHHWESHVSLLLSSESLKIYLSLRLIPIWVIITLLTTQLRQTGKWKIIHFTRFIIFHQNRKIDIKLWQLLVSIQC